MIKCTMYKVAILLATSIITTNLHAAGHEDLCTEESDSTEEKNTVIKMDEPAFDNRFTAHSMLIGVGSANVLDTYLSPYNYTGPEIRLQRETMRFTKMANGRISVQTLLQANCSYVENRSQTAHEVAGGLRYAIGWHYNFKPVLDGIRFLAGAMASAYIGGIYNTRNSNNPAQGKADIMIDLSGMAMYNLKIGKHNYLLRYQVNIPLAGVAFSPNYGQSYYELFSLGHYDKNVKFVYPVNMPSMRHLLTVDIPISTATLRLGYAGDFQQAKLNGLKYHSYSNCFMIGFVKYFNRKDRRMKAMPF